MANSEIWDVLIAIVTALGVLAIWIVIAMKVGQAAAEKNRRQWLWTLLSFVPLGPLLAPLWLATMPIVGQKATAVQLMGRTVLILLIVLGQLAGMGQRAFNDAATQKASTEYGYETNTVTTHYKKMGVEEIATCVQLTAKISAMEEKSTSDEEDSLVFETQDEVDTFNTVVAIYEELECGERTYEVYDLNKAMALIEEGNAESIDRMIEEKLNAPESIVNRLNSQTPIMVDESTRLNWVEFRGDLEVVFDFTLVEYQSTEVTRNDLIDVYLPQLESGSCSNPTLAKLRNNGYKLVNQYSGNDGKSIGNLEVTGTCEN